MLNSHVVGKRAALHKSRAKLFDLVCENATEEQWAEWLRVPLEHAAVAGDVTLVNDLLAAGASGKAGWKGCHNRTLLCAAAQGGKTETVKALLKAGAQPDVNVHGGERPRSPLHYAALNGYDGIAELLLMTGASPNSKDSEGIAPIHIAAELGYERIVSLLLMGRAEVGVLRRDNTTPLHLAARKGYLHVARLLLVAGAPVSSRDKEGHSVLDVAAIEGRVDMIRMLGQRSIDMNAFIHVVGAARKGRAALHCAAQNNQAGAVDVLVELGGNIEARVSYNSYTPLHVATEMGSYDALVALLHHKVDVHAKTSDGKSPLMLACMNLDQKAADLLLRWGADETDVDNGGRSADQLIGARVIDDDHEGRRQDIDSMHQLLANAPADRTWRRRGWLVLCRAIPNKTWLGVASNQDSDGIVGEEGKVRSQTKSTITFGKAQKLNASTGADDGGGEAETAIASSASAGREAWGDSCSVDAGIVGLGEEILFRHIVTFL